MKTRVTLRDLAKAAGVHYSTVSMALRDHPRISAPIREKVRKLADEMGYSPDPALAALNAYRKAKLPVHYQSTLAWVDNWKGPEHLRGKSTFNEYFLGAVERARQLGYELEEFRMEEQGRSPDRASAILKSRGIKGLLLAPQPAAGTSLPLNFDWFSSVTFGYSIQPQVFHLVTNHQFHSMTLALKKLVGLGYRKIGLFLREDVDDRVDNAYVTGFWHFFRRHRELPYLEPRLVGAGESEPEVFARWFREVRPEVVVSAGGRVMIDLIQQLGLRVPDDVGYVRLSVPSGEEYFSGVYQNGMLIGRTAVDFLVAMLQRGEVGFPNTPIRILVEGEWKPGQTVRNT